MGLAVGPAPAESDTQKIVYLSDRGPILIALHLRIDGESLAARHRTFTNAVFAYLDRDGDGVLSQTEAALAPTAGDLTNPLVLIGRREVNPVRVRLGRTGKVTREELAAHYRKTGLPPFQNGDLLGLAIPFRGPAPTNESVGEQLTDRLFALLDADKDGKLSRKELEAAPAVLRHTGHR